MSTVVKYHALGNDYLVADPAQGAPAPGADATRLLCDRHTGVGADGVLYGPLPARGGADGADVFDVRVFNSDGSECARSANGLRVFARYLREHGHTERDEITVRTSAGTVHVRLGGRPGIGTIDLGTWTHHDPGQPGGAELVDLPVELAPGVRVNVTAVFNGVPHVVMPVDDADAGTAARLGPALVGHSRFPARPNVEFLTVEDRRTIRIEIWERGAGYTLASGSGACAAACAARRLGLVDDRVTVVMPGGSVQVEIDGDERVLLTGSCSRVGSTTLADEFLSLLNTERQP
ncbi:diaminopimelate epimerase [Streptomyces sp. NPDC088760]|uniref:diaminopimelate epimerase n=1 Tax=Streptomyces sp. NPDC088760 TaxID=3365890 RepID=UPI00382B7041